MMKKQNSVKHNENSIVSKRLKNRDAIVKRLFFLLTAFCLMSFTSAGAYAGVGDVINLQLGTSGYDYTGSAAINNGDQTWNLIEFSDDTLVNMKDSNGQNSDISVTTSMDEDAGLAWNDSAFAGPSDYDSSADRTLMLGYLSTVSNTGSINFSGLEAGTYKVYVYSQVGTGVNSNLDLTANDVGFNLSNNGDLTTLTEGKNWVSHTVQVGSDGTLNMTIGTYSQINGIQIEAVSDIQAVPEPRSIGLFGVGSIFILAIMRLRSKGSYALGKA